MATLHVSGKDMKFGESIVQTKDGLIPKSELDLKVETFDELNCLIVATEWYYKGELVRRDVWVNGLQAPPIGATQAELG